jgi:hypothetical protein
VETEKMYAISAEWIINWFDFCTELHPRRSLVFQKDKKIATKPEKINNL